MGSRGATPPPAEVRVPLECVDVHEHGAAGIGHICHVHPTIAPPRQVLGGREGGREEGGWEGGREGESEKLCVYILAALDLQYHATNMYAVSYMYMHVCVHVHVRACVCIHVHTAVH